METDTLSRHLRRFFWVFMDDFGWPAITVCLMGLVVFLVFILPTIGLGWLACRVMGKEYNTNTSMIGVPLMMVLILLIGTCVYIRKRWIETRIETRSIFDESES